MFRNFFFVTGFVLFQLTLAFGQDADGDGDRNFYYDSLGKHIRQRPLSPEQADSLVLQIEHLHTSLNTISNESRYGFKTQTIEEQLPQMQATLQIIKQNLTIYSGVLNIKNLEMFSMMLKDMEEQLDEWRTSLFTDSRDLIKMNAEMSVLSEDSLIKKIASDTTFANLYTDELRNLSAKWEEAKVLKNQKLTAVTKLQSSVSKSYFLTIELRDQVRNLIAKSGIRTFRQEYTLLWNKHYNPDSARILTALARQSRDGQEKVILYYFKSNIQNWLWGAFYGLVFFLWVFLNFRRLKQSGGNWSEGFTFQYLKPIPVFATLVFILNIAPFLDFNPPSVYIEIVEFILLVSLTAIFYKQWPRNLFFSWLGICVVAILVAVVHSIAVPSLPFRIFMLVVNVVAVLAGFLFRQRYAKTMTLPRTVKAVAGIFIVLNLFAVFCNMYGRLTVGKLASTGAVLGLIQIMGIVVFIRVMTEAFYLQMKGSRVGSGKNAVFDFTPVETDLNGALTVAGGIGWVIIFMANMDLYYYFYHYIVHTLTAPQKFGSTVFSWANIILFMVIIYLSTLTQKYVGFLLGETEEDYSGDLEKRSSRLVIIRLVIIVGGFLMAVVASGLPVDKITVVLGALGVGIGLGLQNIVGNFISGLILIFEKPLKIGDYIEVGDKSGRVQDIGLRSSKLTTTEGSEVIVPNSDILSSHVVNWTSTGIGRRIQLSLTIESVSNLQVTRDIIKNVLENTAYVVKGRPVDIHIKDITEKSVELIIHVWINNFYKEQDFKSEALSKIYGQLAEKGIKMV